MKFEHKYPAASSTDKFEFEYSYVTKTPYLGNCRWCGNFTRWLDVIFQTNVCSEECNGAMWQQYKNDQLSKGAYESFEQHFEQVKQELLIAESARDASKDILIVVHDQLEYFQPCIESIRETTKNYHLYIWDNGSQEKTKKYIEDLVHQYNAQRCEDYGLTAMRSDKNTGFIFPNNEMAQWGDSEYIILINSDTKVFAGWDTAMTGFLDQNSNVAQVGYWGGHLDKEGRGFGGGNGQEIDYVSGSCFCISRETYQNYGLFDKNLVFAYCEDADFSLRLKEAGKEIYALYSSFVHHYQNKTIKAVEKEPDVDVRETFRLNHQYMKERWKDYLVYKRVLRKEEKNAQEIV